jgi:molecular chaperone GrpE
MNASEEEFVPEEEAEEGPGLVKRLRERLKKAVEEKQEYLEGWQRSRADFANYKKEEAAMHGEREDRAKMALIEKFLPALDALELAAKHHPEDKNLTVLEKQFAESLRALGVERFGAIGEDFDPRRHEALAMKGTEHVVESVERSGYCIGDKIIRPAQVII